MNMHEQSPFDEIIDRRGTQCQKWDDMERFYGVSPEDGIAMWVADMDFRSPACIQDALREVVDHGIFGYSADDGPYRAAIDWWMRNRHGWSVDPDWIFTTHGLVNGTAMCVDTFTEPGDGIVLMTPVYHAFARVIRAAERRVVECPLTIGEDGRYAMDFDAWDTQMTGDERMIILCSPHNPGGRVWRRHELEAVADFARRHDLLIVSDEIHHDIVYPGHRHIPMIDIDGIAERLVMMTAASKTFNIAGAHVGNIIVPDAKLRTRFAARMKAMGMSANSFGLHMVTAAYSPAGAAWVDMLVPYLDRNRALFDDTIASIPGLRTMPLEATFLSWVDFSGTGMSREEFTARVETDARIAVNRGATFGKGGESFLRFNFAAPRRVIDEAVGRLSEAFADLQ